MSLISSELYHPAFQYFKRLELETLTPMHDFLFCSLQATQQAAAHAFNYLPLSDELFCPTNLSFFDLTREEVSPFLIYPIKSHDSLCQSYKKDLDTLAFRVDKETLQFDLACRCFTLFEELIQKAPPTDSPDIPEDLVLKANLLFSHLSEKRSRRVFDELRIIVLNPLLSVQIDALKGNFQPIWHLFHRYVGSCDIYRFMESKTTEEISKYMQYFLYPILDSSELLKKCIACMYEECHQYGYIHLEDDFCELQTLYLKMIRIAEEKIARSTFLNMFVSIFQTIQSHVDKLNIESKENPEFKLTHKEVFAFIPQIPFEQALFEEIFIIPLFHSEWKLKLALIFLLQSIYKLRKLTAHEIYLLAKYDTLTIEQCRQAYLSVDRHDLLQNRGAWYLERLLVLLTGKLTPPTTQ